MSLFDTGVRPAIDRWLLKKSEEVRDYGEYWSASSAGYCMRKNLFDRLQVPYVESEDAARKQRVFTAGQLFHDWIQTLTKEAGLSIAQEVELQDEGLMVRGHFDDLVLVKGKLVLYDYKTQNSRAFNYKRPNMSHYHKYQLGTYMYMLRKKTRKLVFPTNNPTYFKAYSLKNLAEARILKISKDDLRMTEEQLLWSEELETKIVNYWKTLSAWWEKFKVSGELPPCSCANYEGSFMAKEKWNGRFYNGEPCSIDWFNEYRERVS